MSLSALCPLLLVLLLLLWGSPYLSSAWQWPLSTVQVKEKHSPPHHSGLLPTHTREQDAKALWQRLEDKGHFSLCWKEALDHLKNRCASSSLQDYTASSRQRESQRTRLAFYLAKCDAEEDGRSPYMFLCKEKADTRQCIQALSESAYGIFVQYRLHADVLCAYLQEEVFQQRTEATIDALQRESAAAAEVMMELHLMEQEIVLRSRETISLQDLAREALEGLQSEVTAIQQQQHESFLLAQGTAESLLNATRAASDQLMDVQRDLGKGAQEALLSIHNLSNQTFHQYHHIHSLTSDLLGEVTRLDTANRSILAGFASFPAAHIWIAFCFFLLVPLSVSVRERVLSMAIVFALSHAPSAVRHLPLSFWWAGELPWSAVGWAVALVHLMWCVLHSQTTPGQGPPPVSVLLSGTPVLSAMGPLDTHSLFAAGSCLAAAPSPSASTVSTRRPSRSRSTKRNRR